MRPLQEMKTASASVALAQFPFFALSYGGLLLIAGGILGAPPAQALGKRRIEPLPPVSFPAPSPSPSPLLRSQVVFGAEVCPQFSGRKAKRCVGLHLPDAAVADWVMGCPLAAGEQNLRGAADELLSKVRESLARVHDATTAAGCANLRKRLDSANDQLQGALKNTFVGSVNIADTTNQDAINEATQRALAVNSLVQTTGDLIQNDCIANISDRAAIQSLVGNVVSLAGLLVGGWPGIATAAGGQLIGRLPLFQDEVEGALKGFKEYEERRGRQEFLCLHRQMRKTGCLLFPDPNNPVVQGVDLSFHSGPGAKTRESLNDFARTAPGLHADALFLNQLSNTPMPGDTVEALAAHCAKGVRTPTGMTGFLPPQARTQTAHPTEVTEVYQSYEGICRDLLEYRFPDAGKPRERLVQKFKQGVALLTLYRDQVREKNATLLASVIRTDESWRFFEALRKQGDQYRDTSAGNSFRLAYRALVLELGGTLAVDTLQDIAEQNRRLLKKEAGVTPSSRQVRTRALQVWLDACQTTDPTLGCLTIGDLNRDELVRRWVDVCVGPPSRLCKAVKDYAAGAWPAHLPRAAVYLNSLCPGSVDRSVLPPFDSRGDADGFTRAPRDLSKSLNFYFF